MKIMKPNTASTTTPPAVPPAIALVGVALLLEACGAEVVVDEVATALPSADKVPVDMAGKVDVGSTPEIDIVWVVADGRRKNVELFEVAVVCSAAENFDNVVEDLVLVRLEVVWLLVVEATKKAVLVLVSYYSIALYHLFLWNSP